MKKIKQLKRYIKKLAKKVKYINIRKGSIKEWELIVRKKVKKPAEKLLPYINDECVFIDVGANIGAFTEAILSENNNIRAYLFEPVPRYYKILKNKFVKHSNVDIQQYALSDETGEFPIWVDTINFGWNTMVSKKITGHMEKINISTIIFDDFVESHNIKNIDVIKIDVEGLEYKVINGMRYTLSKLNKKPVILCEVGWGKDAHPHWDKEVEIFEWLFNNGYQRFNYNEIDSTQDVLFIPN